MQIVRISVKSGLFFSSPAAKTLNIQTKLPHNLAESSRAWRYEWNAHKVCLKSTCYVRSWKLICSQRCRTFRGQFLTLPNTASSDYVPTFFRNVIWQLTLCSELLCLSNLCLFYALNFNRRYFSCSHFPFREKSSKFLSQIGFFHSWISLCLRGSFHCKPQNLNYGCN